MERACDSRSARIRNCEQVASACPDLMFRPDALRSALPWRAKDLAMSLPLKLAWGSVAVGILVLALKFAAFWLTGSIALYSDALESIINVVTGVVAVLSIRWSMKPPDPGHPYGHHKAEYLSAVFEGVLIVIAALSILHEAYVGFLQPKPLDAPVQGLLVNGLASAINAVWCWVLIGQGRRHRSPALVADGRHLLTDVITSGGVLVGVALVAVTGWAVLDPALAALERFRRTLNRAGDSQIPTGFLHEGWERGIPQRRKGSQTG